MGFYFKSCTKTPTSWGKFKNYTTKIFFSWGWEVEINCRKLQSLERGLP